MPNPRKPEEEKKLTGTARKDRVGGDSIEAPALDVLPDAPSFLNKIGRKHWKKYTKLLQNEGILVENDLELLGLYCMHLQIAEKAAETLRDELFLPSVNENGETYYVGTTAVLRTFNEASAAALKIGQQFGFTPAARKNIPAPKVKKTSKLQALMDNRNQREGVFKVA